MTKPQTFRLPLDALQIIADVKAEEAADGNRLTNDAAVTEALRMWGKARQQLRGTEITTPRSFRAHVEMKAQDASPKMRAGLYETVGEFYAAIALQADPDELFEEFEPGRGNEWLRPGYAGAVAYSPKLSTEGFPFTFAEYIEGDVRRYNFPRFEDAARAARLWRAGLS